MGGQQCLTAATDCAHWLTESYLLNQAHGRKLVLRTSSIDPLPDAPQRECILLHKEDSPGRSLPSKLVVGEWPGRYLCRYSR